MHASECLFFMYLDGTYTTLIITLLKVTNKPSWAGYFYTYIFFVKYVYGTCHFYKISLYLSLSLCCLVPPGINWPLVKTPKNLIFMFVQS